MKAKLLILGILLGFSINVYSQTDAIIVRENGNVGIGCDPGNYNAVLKIHKEGPSMIELNNGISSVQLCVAAEGWDGASESKPGDAILRTIHGGNLDRHGLILFMSNNDMDGRSYIKFGDAGHGLWFSILNNKKVRIDGEVIAKRITVKTDVWADDVFDANYSLMTLPEIESYIKQHNHLPDVPCAEEVIEEGINVSEMNAILLRKVEELTLHLIEQNKRIDAQEKQIEELRKNNN